MRLVVVLLGPEGSFSDIGIEKAIKNAKKKYVFQIKDIFAKTTKGIFGFVPVENKIVGEIKDAKQVKEGKWKILKTVELPVKFVLGAIKKMEFSKIKSLYCAQIAQSQCKKFIKKYLKNAKIVSNFASTSAAFKKIVQRRDFSAAVIGSRQACKIYGFKVLVSEIQDKKNDWTRFALFVKNETKTNKKSKLKAPKKEI